MILESFRSERMTVLNLRLLPLSYSRCKPGAEGFIRLLGDR